MRLDPVVTSTPDTSGTLSTANAGGPAPNPSAQVRPKRYPPSAASGINLKPGEIASAFDPLRDQYDPILTPDAVAQMLSYSRSTIYEWIAKGRLDGCFRKRGKHVRLWRDRVLHTFFNGPDWN